MSKVEPSPLNLSFIIPVFDEEDSLVALKSRISEVVKSNTLGTFEIIFVDDGSRDRSWEVIKELVASDPEVVKGLKFRRNSGKAAALSVGFLRARGEVIFTLDADLQDDPKEIPSFLKKLNEGFDLVSGWKKKRLDPLEKRIPSKLFNYVTCKVAGFDLHDFNCGFKAYRREVIEHIKLYGELHRYIPVLAYSEGYRVAEIPVEHHSRQFGSSKYGWERYFKGFLDLLTVMAITRFSHRPAHFFGGGGLVLGIIGVIILGVLSFNKIIFGIPIAARPLFFLGILSVLLSMQLISLGILAEIFNKSAPDNPEAMIGETVGGSSS